MRVAIRLRDRLNVTCFALTLILTVTNVINSSPEFKKVFSSCRAEVTFFKKSMIANIKLKELAANNSNTFLKTRTSNENKLHFYHVEKTN